jgi:hypothetical protein
MTEFVGVLLFVMIYISLAFIIMSVIKNIAKNIFKIDLEKVIIKKILGDD